MCASTATARKQVKASKHERPDPSPVRGTADVFLTLPAVHRKVPRVSKSNLNAKRWAEIALLLLDLADEKDIKVVKDFDPRSVIDQALSSWASAHCGDIQVLSNFSMGVSLNTDDQNSYVSKYGEDDEKKTWQLGLYPSRQLDISVKVKVEALEARFPGLGHAAVKYAERAGYHTIAMYSPGFAFDQAQYVYWYGTDNDEDFLSERESYYDGDEEALSIDAKELLKPSDFTKSFPEFFFKPNEMTTEQLNAISESQDSEAAEIARVMLDMHRLMEEGARLPDLEGCEVQQAYFSVLMRWDKDDALTRYYDDFINMCNECSDGYTDMFGIGSVPLDKAAFQQWAAQTQKGFELYSKLDRLMQLIGTVV